MKQAVLSPHVPVGQAFFDRWVVLSMILSEHIVHEQTRYEAGAATLGQAVQAFVELGDEVTDLKYRGSIREYRKGPCL